MTDQDVGIMPFGGGVVPTDMAVTNTTAPTIATMAGPTTTHEQRRPSEL